MTSIDQLKQAQAVLEQRQRQADDRIADAYKAIMAYAQYAAENVRSPAPLMTIAPIATMLQQVENSINNYPRK